jgi:hypothetical protein
MPWTDVLVRRPKDRARNCNVCTGASKRTRTRRSLSALFLLRTRSAAGVKTDYVPIAKATTVSSPEKSFSASVRAGRVCHINVTVNRNDALVHIRGERRPAKKSPAQAAIAAHAKR